jgi:uncharacterized membrane protein
MHFFGAGRLLFVPFLLGFGLLKILLFIGLIILIVRLASGHRHAAYAGGYGHPWHHYQGGPQDPRQIARMRYAAGKITLEEYNEIIRTLDGGA